MSETKKSSLRKKQSIVESVIRRNLPSDWITQPGMLSVLQGNTDRMVLIYQVKFMEALQGRVNEWIQKSKEEKAMQPNLFTEQEYRNDNLPSFTFKLSEFGIASANYKLFTDASERISQTVFKHEFIDDKGQRVVDYIPMFRKIRILKEGNKELGQRERNTSVTVRLNPDFAEYAFDMTTYNRFLKDVVLNTHSKYTARIYLFINANIYAGANRFREDKTWTVDYMELRKMVGVDRLDENNKWYSYNYEVYANFKRKVLVDSQKELDELAAKNQTDCYFTFEEVFPGRLKRGNPEKIVFHIHLSQLGRDVQDSRNSTSEPGPVTLMRDYFSITWQRASQLNDKAQKLGIEESVFTGEILRIKAYIDAKEQKGDKVDKAPYAIVSLDSFMNSFIREAEVIDEKPAAQEHTMPLFTEPDERWDRFVELTREKMGEKECSTWIAPLSFVKYENGDLHLRAPSSFVIETIESRYGQPVMDAIEESFGKDTRLFWA